MPRIFADYRVFWREFRENYHTTGAVLPSGRPLAAALCHYLQSDSGPKRVLEVGPGTGAVTRAIVRHLGPNDSLDLVELNERFVRRLEERFATESDFQAVSSRARVLHQRVEELPADQPYDLIISGLPLNNFSVASVEQILAALQKLLRPGGTLSFFEYLAIRPMRAAVGGREQRERLRGIGQALDRILSAHEIRRTWVFPNLPPACVHHVRVAPPPPVGAVDLPKQAASGG